MTTKKQNEYEIRTIDQHGDVIDLVWSGPWSQNGFKAATEMARKILATSDGDVAAVALEKTTFISDSGGVGLKDIENETLVCFGSTTALENGGWLE